MNTKIFYKGNALTLQEFCNSIGFNYEDIEIYAQSNNVTLEEATTHYFPVIYINILGGLVMPD